MTQKLDYSREEAMQILNNESYSEEDKRKVYDEYMNSLKLNRKNAIVNKLNEYAKNIPVITKEIYISKLKEYEVDDLSKPFDVIEAELANFESDMKAKYDAYIQSQQPKVEEPVVAEPEEEITPDVSPAPVEEENFDDTIFTEPVVAAEEDEEVKPSLLITDQISVLNESTEDTEKPLFDNVEEAKEVIPEDTNDEKGSASAIILSIIAVIIGIVVMHSIIKLN